MCMGDSRHQFMQIFIQTLNCTVSVYQGKRVYHIWVYFLGETHLFDRQLVTSIHPGPVVYATISKCFYSTSGGFLSCYPFHSFTATAGTGSQHKRLNVVEIPTNSIYIKPLARMVVQFGGHRRWSSWHGYIPRPTVSPYFMQTSSLLHDTRRKSSFYYPATGCSDMHYEL